MNWKGIQTSRGLFAKLSWLLLLIPLLLIPVLMTAQIGGAQTASQAKPYERTYPQSKNAVEKALKKLQPSLSGRLPALEGFAVQIDHPLSRYQRGYYQSAVQVVLLPWEDR